MNSSWVVQPVKKCIKHYTYKNSHILWMFAVHHNFVVTFPRHKLKKKNDTHPHTHTHTDPYTETHPPCATPSREYSAWDWSPWGTKGWSHPQGSPSSSMLNATRWGERPKKSLLDMQELLFIISKVLDILLLKRYWLTSSSNCSIRQKLSFLFYRWENWDSMNLSNTCPGS